MSPSLYCSSSPFWTRFRGLERRHWARGVVLGTIALVIPNTLFTLGLEELPVNIGGLLIALIPIATVAAAHSSSRVSGSIPIDSRFGHFPGRDRDPGWARW